MHKCSALAHLAILFLSAPALAQTTTLSAETANNTSACSSVNGYCQGVFTGMTDSASGTFNAAPGNTSLQDMHVLEYSGATTAIYAHFLPWFCMQSGSTVTGTAATCNGHVQVGYNSNDPNTVKAQMDDMQARGIRGPVIDWYGPNSSIEEGTSELVKSDLEGRCGGGTCNMQFALSEDQGSLARTCSYNGGGVDQTSCIVNAIEGDLDFMNANYFPSPAYLRVDGTTMTPSAQGRPVVFFFICEECFTNPSPNWTTVFRSLRQHVNAYTVGAPMIWFIFRNSGAFTHVESDGGFAWVNHYGSNDPYGLVYLDNYYDTARKFPRMQPWGGVWKGFDNTLAAWMPAVSITGQQCGNTWLKTFSEMTHNNDYGPSLQLPFMQIVTWNDYDEGSEIETGIDNCLNLQASTDGTNLNWNPAFAGAGSENSVHHYDVYSTTDGENLTAVASNVPAGTHGIPLNSINAAAGQSFYVKAVGQASILNKMSNAVTYTPPPTTVTGVSPNSGTTAGGTVVTISGTNFQAGAAVTIGGIGAAVRSVSSTSIAATTPAHAAGPADVSVTNPGAAAVTLAAAYTYVAPAPPPQSFALSASPTSTTVTKGSTATYSVKVTPKNSYTGPVVFSVTGLPSGSSASFSPTSVTTSGTTKLSVTTRSSPRGTFKLTVKGSNASKGLSSTVVVTLTVR